VVFGLNGFLNFMPPPPEMPEEIVAVVAALAKAGVLPVAMGTQLLVGVLLLANLFVPWRWRSSLRYSSAFSRSTLRWSRRRSDRASS